MQKIFEILFALSPFIFIVFGIAFLINFSVKKMHKGLKKYPTYWLALTIGGVILVIYAIINGTNYPELFIGLVSSVSGAYKTYTKLKNVKQK